MQVELVSPEQIVWTGDATQVIARTLDGDIAFLEGHAPFIGALAVATVRVWPVDPTDGEVVALAVHGGFVEVSGSAASGSTVTIIADVAELGSEIDVERANEARERADRAVQAESNDAEAAAALKRAETRILASQGGVAN